MRVIVGITGGIAAYKATGIIRLLTEAGHTVKVVPTQNALRFIGATTLEALSHNTVDSDLYTDVESVKHVELGQSADLVIVAPASASFLAKYAAGIADDLLGNLLLVTKAPVVVAPAMHSEMWLHSATQQNVNILSARGVKFIQPESGRLTGSDSGIGRLPEPEKIVEAALSFTSMQDLLGKKFLISTGGTREPIDPVRFIGNRSSGKQGVEIALAASRRGADVTLIAANLTSIPSGIKEVVPVVSAAQLREEVSSRLQKVDCLIMAAAVSDYRLLEPSDTKIKKSLNGDSLNLSLIANPDVLAECAKQVADQNLNVLTVGFAAETESSETALVSLAKSKLESKKCDVLVANDVSEGKVFDSDNNSAFIVSSTGRVVAAAGSKALVAEELLDVLADLLSK